MQGMRTVRNGTLDFELVDQIGARSGIEKYIWQVEVQLYDERREMALCFNFTVELKRARVKT